MEEMWGARADDDDVYYYIRWRLKLEGETENMGSFYFLFISAKTGTAG